MPQTLLHHDVNTRAKLATDYRTVRALSERLCEPLVVEDYVIQPMPDCSPTKWHLAHTSWFFETFILKACVPGYESPHPQYDYLFNSYYNAVGARHCRPKRGLISRPTVEESYAYRAHVDRAILDFIENAPDARIEAIEPILAIGLHHEQQHQELMLTDIKNVFWENPMRPAYRPSESAHMHRGNGSMAGMLRADPSDTPPQPSSPPGREQPYPSTARLDWIEFPGGIVRIGHDGTGFAYDNEAPRHQVYLQPFAIGSRLVTAGEYLAFMEAGGYRRPEFWLAEGWTTVQTQAWQSPLYWELHEGDWWQFTLAGMRPVAPMEPVCHVSFFEAEAYASWVGARLPTEAEWETVAESQSVDGNFVDNTFYHPVPVNAEAVNASGPLSPNPGVTRPARHGAELVAQIYGDVWEWTQSSYSPYPGFKAPPGALGEYNGKFMCNQYVLRGGSCATSLSHIRSTYRNFFPADARWQFTGIRLAKDAA